MNIIIELKLLILYGDRRFLCFIYHNVNKMVIDKMVYTPQEILENKKNFGNNILFGRKCIVFNNMGEKLNLSSSNYTVGNITTENSDMNLEDARKVAMNPLNTGGVKIIEFFHK